MLFGTLRMSDDFDGVECCLLAALTIAVIGYATIVYFVRGEPWGDST